jgi:hypothetical protein
MMIALCQVVLSSHAQTRPTPLLCKLAQLFAGGAVGLIESVDALPEPCLAALAGALYQVLQALRAQATACTVSVGKGTDFCIFSETQGRTAFLRRCPAAVSMGLNNHAPGVPLLCSLFLYQASSYEA